MQRPADVQLSLDGLLAVMPDAAVGVDQDGRVVAANAQAAALFGHSTASLLGLPVEALVPERYRGNHHAHRAAYRTDPQTRPMGAGIVLFGLRRDGTEFPAEIMLTTLDAGGPPTVVAAIRDVSERVSLEAAARLAAVVDSTSDAILSKDRDGVVTSWNAAAERLYGWTREEMIGRPITTIIPPERREETAAVIARVLAGEAVGAYRTERVTRSGERVTVSVAISPIRDTTGRVLGASTIARDIRDQLRAEDERSYTDALVQHSADAIVAVDGERGITAWNPAAERLFGITAEEARGADALTLLGGGPPVAERRAVLDDVLAGRPRVYDAQRETRDGRLLDLSISTSPLRDSDGRVTGAVSIIRDVTAAADAERRAAEAARREASLLAELQQTRRLESLGQLAGGVAHDFNNLLGVIINYAQFVLDALPEGGQARDDVEEVVRAAQRGADLTRQLLIFSRREVVRPEVVEVDALLSGMEGLLRRALGERVELRIRTAPGLWRVRADRGQLEQVLVNLVVNGRDAMVDGGVLLIEVENVALDAEAAAQHGELEEGGYVLVRVTDQGVGMTPEVMERAFEPFFTTKPKGEGTGLGLATVFGIVRESGGRVALYSEPGHGTSVKVYLPATDAPAAPKDGRRSPAPRGAGEVVLVVEDQEEVRLAAARILADAGYEVLAADRGDQALALMRGRRVDLLLTDVIMPGLIGPELARRAAAAQPGLRIVFMSGYSDRLFSDSAREERPDDGFIEKPFSAAQLQEAVRRRLDAR